MSKKEIRIDQHSIEQYLSRDFMRDQIDLLCNSDKQASSSRKVIESLGYYKFPWGLICERLVGTYFVVWIFKITTPADHDDNHYRSQVYKRLEELFPDYSSEQAIFAAGLYDSWCIYPGTSNETFAVAATLQVEQKAREWVAENILCNAISDLLPRRINL
tara:strand:+ start:2930 stop:3409 length:480 start_codon:yes stop_codon:yes gene_type:complete